MTLIQITTIVLFWFITIMSVTVAFKLFLLFVNDMKNLTKAYAIGTHRVDTETRRSRVAGTRRNAKRFPNSRRCESGVSNTFTYVATEPIRVGEAVVVNDSVSFSSEVVAVKPLDIAPSSSY